MDLNMTYDVDVLLVGVATIPNQRTVSVILAILSSFTHHHKIPNTQKFNFSSTTRT
jgi:hypothetical protein